MVEATLNYLAEMPERPAYYFYEPPAGTPWRNTRGDRRRVAIRDARALTPPPALDREGFVLVPLQSAVSDFSAPNAVHDVYLREVERLVRDVTGAVRVLAFDHNLRSAAVSGRRADGLQGPVHFAHNDYTERSGPQRVRDLLPGDAEALIRKRFAVINVWKPINQAVRSAPLAVCEAGSIRAGDLVPTDLNYRDRIGEVYSLTFSPAHRWFYFPDMQVDEAMLLKCYDSDRARARFTAHTAFDDPSASPDAPPRESIEVRTLAFFA